MSTLLYLTPAAINYLTQVVMAALIGGYLLWLARRPRSLLHARLLSGFWGALTAFLAALLAEAALPPTPRLYAVLLQTPLLCLAWTCLIQFAYHFPARPLALRCQARLALGLSGLYTLWEWGYAVFRFVRLRAGVVEYRLDWTDWLLLLFLLWPALVMVRQMYRLTPAPGRFWPPLAAPWRHPPTPQVRALRAFSLIFMGVAALSLLNVLRTFYLIPVALANIGIEIGILTAMFAFALAYLNRSGTASFIVKLSGFALVTMLSILGMVGWVIAPTYMADYRHALTAPRALRFTTDAAGGYQIAEIPFSFDRDMGRDLELDDGLKAGCSEPLDWPFPFFGQTYRQVYVCNDGVISLGQAVRYREYQYHYGAGAPLLMPLLLDLDPDISPGGVFARQEADRLIVTWDRLRGFRRPQAEFTVQAVLYADGRFDFVYVALPETLLFLPNDDPGASLWAIGALPGGSRDRAPEALSLTDLPARGSAQGMVYDVHLEFRRCLHRLLAPVVWLILASGALIAGGLPLLFYASLVRPLNALLRGVRKMEAGQLESRAPVLFDDEIGSLARSFNAMAAALDGLIHNLEAHVAERTAELDVANAHLRAEIAGREQAQAALIEQQRDLAALEERERLGRDLHDGLGQVLGYINVQTQAARALFGRGQNAAGDALLSRLADIAQQGHADVREFILGMRTDRQPAGAQDFLAGLKKYILHCEQLYGQTIRLDAPQTWNAQWLSQTAELHLLRIIQEALSNALRHAHAQRVEVRLEQRGNELVLTVSDDGVGFEASGERRMAETASPAQPPGHFGLDMMRERAARAGGQIDIQSAPGRGTQISLRFPIALPVDGPAAGAVPRKPLRLLLADDQPIFLEGLGNLLMSQGIQVVGMAHDGLDAQEQVRQARPDVLVMDLEMPRCGGLEATRRIHAEFPDLPILILTVSASEADLFAALKAGAAGYLLKNMEADAFFDLLFNLARETPPIAPELAERMRDEFVQPSSEAVTVDAELTPQQQQVLSLVAQGLTYREVGQKLYLSEATIKYHMKQILDRLHLRSRQQAIAYARRGGMASVE